MSERLRAHAYVEWRKHVRKCLICGKPADADTIDRGKLCELGRELRRRWKEPK